MWRLICETLSSIMLFPVNRETRKLIAVIHDLLFLIAVNCAQDPPYGPSYQIWGHSLNHSLNINYFLYELLMS